MVLIRPSKKLRSTEKNKKGRETGLFYDFFAL
jgi:hypothetical protein